MNDFQRISRIVVTVDAIDSPNGLGGLALAILASQRDAFEIRATGMVRW